MKIIAGNMMKGRVPLFLILGCFLLIAVASCVSSPVRTEEGCIDEIEQLKRNDGSLFHSLLNAGPGFPLVVRLLSSTGIEVLLAGRILSVFFAMVLLWGSWHIFSEVLPEGMSFVATALIGLNPLFIASGISATGDTMAAAMLWLSWWLFFVSRRYQLWGVFLSGILAGFAGMTRYEGLIAFFVSCSPLSL